MSSSCQLAYPFTLPWQKCILALPQSLSLKPIVFWCVNKCWAESFEPVSAACISQSLSMPKGRTTGANSRVLATPASTCMQVWMQVQELSHTFPFNDPETQPAFEMNKNSIGSYEEILIHWRLLLRWIELRLMSGRTDNHNWNEY